MDNFVCLYNKARFQGRFFYNFMYKYNKKEFNSLLYNILSFQIWEEGHEFFV